MLVPQWERTCRGNGSRSSLPPAASPTYLVDDRPVANPVVNSTRHTTFIHARWTNLSLPKRRPNQTARGRLPGPTQALTAGQFKVQQASPLQMHRRRRRLADDDDEAVESLKTETETPRRRRRLASCKQGICMEQERVLVYVFVAREHKSRALQQHREGKRRGEKSPL